MNKNTRTLISTGFFEYKTLSLPGVVSKTSATISTSSTRLIILLTTFPIIRFTTMFYRDEHLRQNQKQISLLQILSFKNIQ